MCGHARLAIYSSECLTPPTVADSMMIENKAVHGSALTIQLWWLAKLLTKEKVVEVRLLTLPCRGSPCCSICSSMLDDRCATNFTCLEPTIAIYSLPFQKSMMRHDETVIGNPRIIILEKWIYQQLPILNC